MVNPDFETEGTQPEYVKDLYAVYPVHIRRFLSRFGVTTLEMTEMLGLPSVQEWYRIKKNDNERVRNTVVCSLLRAYTEHPEWLLANQPTFREIAIRMYWLLRDHGYRRRKQIVYAICQVFDKSQHILRSWYTGEAKADQASTRMIEMMMRLDNDSLFDLISDARLSAISQVHGKDVSVYRLPSGEKRYSLSGDDTLYTLDEIAHKGPLPGSRRTNKDYVPGGTPRHLPETHHEVGRKELPDVVKKTEAMSQQLPWR